MQVGEHQINAIIDTGSQINVVRGEIARHKIRRVIDTSAVLTQMNDANGGQGQLQGMLRGVELNCGGLITTANIWVSNNAPFDLLLGRPWQPANRVSIEERRDGTYLIFKDHADNPRFEMLGAPAEEEFNGAEIRAFTCTYLETAPPEFADEEEESEKIAKSRRAMTLPNWDQQNDWKKDDAHLGYETPYGLSALVTTRILENDVEEPLVAVDCETFRDVAAPFDPAFAQQRADPTSLLPRAQDIMNAALDKEIPKKLLRETKILAYQRRNCTDVETMDSEKRLRSPICAEISKKAARNLKTEPHLQKMQWRAAAGGPWFLLETF
uniref:Peptidase A2 domain-containing protein n=1 Tax=Mycena chlorophos TaxID=658473 RepID=A0ABQ0LCM5_MYCCL|nr:predicted protein [Mycena chlorophos]